MRRDPGIGFSVRIRANAAYFPAIACGDPAIAQQYLEVYAKCHNASFRRYLNRGMKLFPFQTRDGNTGKVLDSAPSVPEGDPLYHSNLCFMDMLSCSR